MKTKMNLSKPARIGIAALAATSIIAGATGTANAGGLYYLHAGHDYAFARTRTWKGTQGRSFAAHGRRAVASPWTTAASSAFADSGWSKYSRASVYFR